MAVIVVTRLNSLCHRLSMRTNCYTIWTAVRAAWSGVVSPMMHVSSMTPVSAKAQAAFPPLNPSTLLGPSTCTIGIVSQPLPCLSIPIPHSLALGQRLSPMLCSSDYPIPLRSVIVSNLTQSRCDLGTYPALVATVIVRTSYQCFTFPCSLLVTSPCPRLVVLVFQYVNVHHYCLASSVAWTGLVLLLSLRQYLACTVL